MTITEECSIWVRMEGGFSHFLGMACSCYNDALDRFRDCFENKKELDDLEIETYKAGQPENWPTEDGIYLLSGTFSGVVNDDGEHVYVTNAEFQEAEIRVKPA